MKLISLSLFFLIASCSQFQSTLLTPDPGVDESENMMFINKEVESFVQARLDFHDFKDKSKKGAMYLKGKYNKRTQALYFEGHSWYKKIKEYDLIKMKGEVNKEFTEFSGKTLYYNCKVFLTKKKSNDHFGTYIGFIECPRGTSETTLKISPY